MKHSYLHRLTALAAVLLLFLSVPFSAGAEGSLRSFVQAGEDLLFHTDNVTCTGSASFDFNGVRFKTAELKYVQVGYRAFQDLKLLTPRADGTERESGYIVFDQEGDVYIIERFTPSFYWRTSANLSDSVLQTNIYLNQLLALGKDLADTLEEPLSDRIQIEEDGTGGTVLHVSLDENVPPLLNSSLNLFWDYALRRYCFMDHAHMPGTGSAGVHDYGTIFEGICYTTARLSLQKMDLDISLDHSGRMAGISGSLTLTLFTRAGESNTLDVSFSFTADQYGSSVYHAFRPSDYNVTLLTQE